LYLQIQVSKVGGNAGGKMNVGVKRCAGCIRLVSNGWLQSGMQAKRQKQGNTMIGKKNGTPLVQSAAGGGYGWGLSSFISHPICGLDTRQENQRTELFPVLP
jgi:hypothetical protein